MAVQQFHLLGDHVSSARSIELSDKLNSEDVKNLIASHFAIVSPNGEPIHTLLIQVSSWDNLLTMR